jgi:hypothetical protein
MTASTILRGAAPAILCARLTLAMGQASPLARQAPAGTSVSDQFNDSHFHLANYVQRGIDVRAFLDIMGARVRRSTVVSSKVCGETASLTNPALDRVLGTVAPAGAPQSVAVYDLYAPLWRALRPEASRKIRFGNYERLFDEGRRRVRVWEKANVR